MPSTNVTPTSDITTTDWATTGSSFHGVLAANSGAGDGTHFVDQTAGTGGTNNLVVGCTFNTSGISVVTAVSSTIAWETVGKSTSEVQIKIYDSTGATLLASMASPITTTSTSVATTGPTSLTLNDGTASDWTNFQINIAAGIGGSTEPNIFGIFITVTYTATSSNAAAAQTTMVASMGSLSGGMQMMSGGLQPLGGVTICKRPDLIAPSRKLWTPSRRLVLPC